VGKRQTCRLALVGLGPPPPWLAFEPAPGKADSLPPPSIVELELELMSNFFLLSSGWNIRLKPRQPPRRTCSEKLSTNILPGV
jgi:hypothetical protein